MQLSILDVTSLGSPFGGIAAAPAAARDVLIAHLDVTALRALWKLVVEIRAANVDR